MRMDVYFLDRGQVGRLGTCKTRSLRGGAPDCVDLRPVPLSARVVKLVVPSIYWADGTQEAEALAA